MERRVFCAVACVQPVKRLTTLFALLLCTVLPAQTVRSLGVSDEDFWKDFSKLYTEFHGKKAADVVLLAFKPIYDDPNWSNRGDFQALAREMLRKRMVEAQSWSEAIQLAQYWYSSASEPTQARWWRETNELVTSGHLGRKRKPRATALRELQLVRD